MPFSIASEIKDFRMVRVDNQEMSTMDILREVEAAGYRPADFEEGGQYNSVATSVIHGPRDFMCYDFDTHKIRLWRRLGNSIGVNYSQDVDMDIMGITWYPDSQGFVLRKLGADPARDLKWAETRKSLGL